MPAAAEAARNGRLRRALLEWFDVHRRDLPWRRRKTPYSVWVSEVMLQQTRAEVVVPHYRRFLARFPTLASLASAPIDDVLAAWSGLGYYRRARLLHAGARVVAALPGARLPRVRAELEAIPGIGDYTAGAISSIAFGLREAAVDGNVARVLARVFALDGDLSRNPARAALRELASGLVDPQRPGDFNEALMDLGSSVCVPRSPRCDACPLANLCRARTQGRTEQLPARALRKAPRAVRLALAVVTSGAAERRSVLFLRRGAGEALMAGLWDLPSVEVESGDDAAAALRARILDAGRLSVELDGPSVSVRHAIVGRDIRADIYVGEASGRYRRTPAPSVKPNATTAFFADEDLGAVALSSLPLKALRALEAARRPDC